MASSRTVVFMDPVRTAIGTFGGSLKKIAATDLGAVVIKAGDISKTHPILLS